MSIFDPNLWDISLSKDGKEMLVNPSAQLMACAQWKQMSDKYRWCRSLHLDVATQQIISCGYPKFFNLGEDRDVTIQTLVNEDNLMATEKLDGSLLVRYVQRGEVKFRLRGSLEMWVPNAHELDDMCKANPRLLDPTLYPQYSLLFEWISPTNRIVIKYEKPELVLTGAVGWTFFTRSAEWFYTDIFTLPRRKVQNIAFMLNVRTVNTYQFSDPVEAKEFILSVADKKDIEGYVMCYSKGMVKVKTNEYLLRHAFRSQFHPRHVIELYASMGMPTFDDFEKFITEQFDHECWTYAKDTAYLVTQFADELKRKLRECRQWANLNRHLQRDVFAHEVSKLFSDSFTRSAIFTYLDNKEVQDRALVDWLIARYNAD